MAPDAWLVSWLFGSGELDWLLPPPDDSPDPFEDEAGWFFLFGAPSVPWVSFESEPEELLDAPPPPDDEPPLAPPELDPPELDPPEDEAGFFLSGAPSAPWVSLEPELPPLPSTAVANTTPFGPAAGAGVTLATRRTAESDTAAAGVGDVAVGVEIATGEPEWTACTPGVAAPGTSHDPISHTSAVAPSSSVTGLGRRAATQRNARDSDGGSTEGTARTRRSPAIAIDTITSTPRV